MEKWKTKNEMEFVEMTFEEDFDNFSELEEEERRKEEMITIEEHSLYCFYQISFLFQTHQIKSIEALIEK